MSSSGLEQRNIEITNHHATVYLGAFGENLANLRAARESQGISEDMSVADVGAGDADFYREAAKRQTAVTRIDSAYASYNPDGHDYVAADARSMPEVPDNTYDASISAFLFQHLHGNNGDVASAIKEMVRITKPADEGGGLIIIYPLYRSKKLQRELEESFAGIAGLARTNEAGLADKGLPVDALAIRKDAALTPDNLDALARSVEESGALSRRKTAAHFIRKARMSVTGNRHFNTNSIKR